MLPHISLKLLTSELMTWQRSLVSWCRCRHSICRTVRPIGTCATTRRHRHHPTEKKSIYKAFVCRTLDRVTAAVKFGSRSLALDLQCSRQLLMIFSCLLHITWQYLSTSPYGTLQLRSIHVVQTMLWPSVDSPLVLVVLEGTPGVLHMLHAQRSSANFSHLIPFLIPFLLYGTVCWYKMYEYDSVRPKNEVAANPAEELLVDVTCPPENRRASLTVCRLPAYAHSRLLQEVQ